jgi:DNA-binding MarR family transcriptional regulator
MLTLWQYGEQPVKFIGEKLFLESNTLTPLLKRLEQKQLVSRTRSKEDERTVVIALSKSGKALKTQAQDIPHKIATSFKGDKLTKRDILVFQKTLFKLLEMLGEKSVEKG